MIKIEDKMVGGDPLKAEIRDALRKLKVGQSFLIPAKYGSSARCYATRTEGTFRTNSEEGQLRIGRVA